MHKKRKVPVTKTEEQVSIELKESLDNIEESNAQMQKTLCKNTADLTNIRNLISKLE
jgi:hypothetical protein